MSEEFHLRNPILLRLGLQNTPIGDETGELRRRGFAPRFYFGPDTKRATGTNFLHAARLQAALGPWAWPNREMLSATEPAAAVQSVLTPASVAAEPTQAEPATTPTAAAESEDGRACPAADPAAAPTATPTIASDNTPPAAAAGPATAASAADGAASASFASSPQPPADGNEPDAALDASSTTAVDSPGGENAAAAARSGEVEAAETSTAAAAEAGAGAAGADAADGEQADAVPAAAPAGGDDGVDTARAHIDGTGSPVADISTPGDAIASALQSKTVNAPAASDDSAEARSSTRHMGKRPAPGQSSAYTRLR